MHGQRELGIRIRRHLDRPVVGAHQHRVLLGQPLRRPDADARAALHVPRVVLGPQLVPARVDEHRVARLQRDPLARQGVLQVLGGDLVGVGEGVHALERRDVDEHAAGHEGAHLLDAELGEAAASRDGAGLEAVVVAVLVRLVREAVELGADLADLRDDELLVATPAVGEVVHERALHVHVEASRAEERHLVVHHVGDLDDLARLDELFGPHHACGLHVVARAALVARSPLRRAALALGRHGPGLRRGGGHPCQTEYCGEDDCKEGTWHGRSPLR